jgi:hypothetical protein
LMHPFPTFSRGLQDMFAKLLEPVPVSIAGER